jgi:two-component system, chemotaxis family, sensor kinase CheA
MSDPQSAIIHEFLVESFDNLSNINDDLTQYEKNIEDYELLNSIYRKIHTLKGSASFLGLNKLQEITHTVESILDYIRDKTFSVNSDLIDIFLESFDICVALLKNIESTGSEGDLDTSDILRRLKVSLEQELLGQSVPLNQESLGALDLTLVQEGGVEVQGQATQAIEVEENRGDPVDELDGLIAEHSQEGSLKPNIVEEVPASLQNFSDKVPDTKSVEKEEEKEVHKVKSTGPVMAQPTASRSNITESIVRVNVHLLDKIMNVVGELVITRNQILQYSKFKDDADLNRYAQQLNVITTERLQ